jgi:spore coat protein A, manganese oxidase
VIPGNRYKFVWHCHILEHEDNEMMRPMDIIG